METSSVLLTVSEASESAFKGFAPGNRIIHLATQGYFLGGRCPSLLEGSRGVGTLVVVDEIPIVTRSGDTPLLLSGLALAGADHRDAAMPGEDGILTAEEIASLDLRGALVSAGDWRWGPGSRRKIADLE